MPLQIRCYFENFITFVTKCFRYDLKKDKMEEYKRDKPPNDPYEGYYFRSLRPDENIQKLKAKETKRTHNLKDNDERTESIKEHIRQGSNPDYRSPWLSLTADLDVALAFAGKHIKSFFWKNDDRNRAKV